LKRREVSASIVAAPRKDSAAVIVLAPSKRPEHGRPEHGRPAQGRPENGRNKSFRSFSPKSGRRPVRRAV
jgi:hypothetical protein